MQALFGLRGGHFDVVATPGRTDHTDRGFPHGNSSFAACQSRSIIMLGPLYGGTRDELFMGECDSGGRACLDGAWANQSEPTVCQPNLRTAAASQPAPFASGCSASGVGPSAITGQHQELEGKTSPGPANAQLRGRGLSLVLVFACSRCVCSNARSRA